MKQIFLAYQYKMPKGNGVPATLFAKAIQLWTRSKYFHCNIIIDGYVYFMGVDGLDIYHISQENKECYEFVEIPEHYISKYFIDNTILFLEEVKYHKVKYDWSGILLSQVFPFKRHSRRRYFCSELCAVCLSMLLSDDGIRNKLIGKEHLFSPKDLYKFNIKYLK